MTRERIAVIDLGSNTFHLLICEIGKNGSWVSLCKEREYVKLAEGGMEFIDDQAVERAIEAMMRFAVLIKAQSVDRVRAIGTAALREAKNGYVVVDQLTAVTGIQIDIIDGHKEAQYILDGIRSALPYLDQYGLIMDIGGGSVEFILFHGENVAFTGSYRIGVAVLFRKYHLSDPISAEEIGQLEHELAGQLDPLIKVLKGFPGYYLIGASGSFEILYDVLPRSITTSHWAEMEISGVMKILDNVIFADLESRRSMPEIPVERLDYIVVAYLLIRFLIKMAPPEKLYYCDFALKEGVVEEMIRENILD